MGRLKKGIEDKLIDIRKVIEIDLQTKEKVAPESLEKITDILYNYLVNHYSNMYGHRKIDADNIGNDEAIYDLLEQYFWWEGATIEERKFVGEFVYDIYDLRMLYPHLYNPEAKFTRLHRRRKVSLLEDAWLIILELEQTGISLEGVRRGIEEKIWRFGRDSEYGKTIIERVNNKNLDDYMV